MSNQHSSLARHAPVIWWLADGIAAIFFAAALAVGASALLDGNRLWLMGAAAALLIVSAGRGVLSVGAAAGGQQAANRAKADWRLRMYPALLTTPPAYRHMMGEAVAEAVDRIEDLDGYHARFIPLRRAAAITPLLIGLAAMAGSWIAGGIMLATLVPFAVGMALAGGAAARAADRQVSALSRLSGLFVDRVRALPIIVSFGAQDRVARHLADATRDVADRSIGVLRIAFLSGAVLDFFAALSVALVAVYCGFNLLDLLPFPVPEKLSLAGALFALALAPEFYLPLRRLAAAYHDKQVGEAAMAQLTAAPALQENPPSPAPGAPAIRFDAVTIDYGDARVGPLSAAVAPGGTLALIGPSGSGKSSLIHALLGLAPIGGGRILHGDMPLDPLCLRGHVGWAGQTLALIPGTLADNIRLARPQADDRAVAHAAHQAGLDTMLAARDCDLSLTLDARGSGLSGGERRRVGIARVLLSDAPLWLLDEPTADLDEESARAIRAILKKASMGRTVILATHDPELMAMADTRTVLA